MMWLRFNFWPISVHLLVWSLTPVLIRVFALAVGRSTYERIQATTALTTSSWMTFSGAGELLQTVVDLETGVRGYALTADPTFLQPYDERLPVVTDQLARLHELVRERPEQRARIDRVAAPGFDVDALADRLDGAESAEQMVRSLTELGAGSGVAPSATPVDDLTVVLRAKAVRAAGPGRAEYQDTRELVGPGLGGRSGW